MSKRHILKKGFAILTVVSMMFVTVSVSAATYYSTTSYDTANKTVTVTSKIKDAEAGEQITYLAYDRSMGETKESGSDYYKPVGGENRNILFIDQDAAGSDGTATFSFTTDANKIGSTLVKFGAGTTSSISTRDEDGDKISYVTATVGAGGGGTVTVNPVGGDEQPVAIGSVPFMFIFDPDDGYKVASVVRSDGVPVSLNSILINANTYTANITNKVELTVYYEKNSIDNESGKEYVANSKGQSGTTPDGKKFSTTFSAAKFKPEQTDYEYGIVFYYDDKYNDDTTLLDVAIVGENWGKNISGTIDATGTEGVNKYRALGRSSNGSFAVQLKDDGNQFFTRAKYYTRPYVAVKTGDDIEVTYGTYTEFQQVVLEN